MYFHFSKRFTQFVNTFVVIHLYCKLKSFSVPLKNVKIEFVCKRVEKLEHIHSHESINQLFVTFSWHVDHKQ